MHRLELGQTIFGRNVLIDLPCNGIERSLYGFAQFDLAHVTAIKVLWSVFNLLVFHKCAGIVSSFKTGRIDDQRLDGASWLPVALIGTVQRKTRIDLLGPSADHCDDLPRTVINTHSRTLHLVLAVVRCVSKVLQFLVHTGLQFFLHLHVERGIDLIAPLEQFRKARVIQFIVYLVVCGALIVAGEIVSKRKIRVFGLHENFRGALIGIRQHICILVQVRLFIPAKVEHDILIRSVVVLPL